MINYIPENTVHIASNIVNKYYNNKNTVNSYLQGKQPHDGSFIQNHPN